MDAKFEELKKEIGKLDEEITKVTERRDRLESEMRRLLSRKFEGKTVETFLKETGGPAEFMTRMGYVDVSEKTADELIKASIEKIPAHAGFIDSYMDAYAEDLLVSKISTINYNISEGKYYIIA